MPAATSALISIRPPSGLRTFSLRYRKESTKYRPIKMWRNTKYARKGSMRIHRHNLQVLVRAAPIWCMQAQGNTPTSLHVF